MPFSVGLTPLNGSEYIHNKFSRFIKPVLRVTCWQLTVAIKENEKLREIENSEPTSGFSIP